MGIAKTVISVAIVGNAKNLIGTINTADAKMGGFLKGAAKGFAAFAVVDKAFDAVGSVLDNAIRAGDAMARLESTLGKLDAGKLKEVSKGFTEIGLSSPDFLELSASFAEIASSTGEINPDSIFIMAEGVGKLAGALARVKDQDPDELAGAAGLFISGGRGAEGAAKLFGVDFDKDMSAFERYNELMKKLPGLLDSVTGANAGLDDKQETLNAKWENFGTDVGPGVEIVLSGVLDSMLKLNDMIPSAIEGWKGLGGVFGEVLSPLARINDVMLDIIRNFPVFQRLAASSGLINAPSTSVPNRFNRNETNTIRDTRDFNQRNGVINNRIGGLGL